MVKYIDSGSQEKPDYIRHWLDQNLNAGCKSFLVQSGYYDFAAIKPFEGALKTCIENGGSVRFVLGSNKRSLTIEDAKATLEIVKGKPDCSLTIVALSQAEFHPKCYLITRADGSRTAVVGSGNLTPNGTALNIEAAIVLDSLVSDSQTEIDKIGASIMRWGSAGEDDGAYQIATSAEADELEQSGILTTQAAKAKQQEQAVMPQPANPKKSLKKSPKHHWSFEAKPHSKDTSAPAVPVYTVLIAEIPNAGTRWRQANFDMDTFESFFGLVAGNNQYHIALQHVAANGQLEGIEVRQGVSVKSQNYRIELNAAHGSYPSSPPIGVFIKLGAGSFRYRLLMPSDPDYLTVRKFLLANWSGPATRKRRLIVDTIQLKKFWPNSPLWVTPLS